MRFGNRYQSGFQRFRDELLGSPLARAFGPLYVGDEGGGGDPPGGGDGKPTEGGGKEIPETIKPYVEELRGESAKYRTRAKAAEDRVTALETQLTEIKGQLGKKQDDPHEGDPKPGDLKAQLAKVQRELDEQRTASKALTERSEKAETRARSKTLRAGVSDVVTRLKLNEPSWATELLAGRAQVEDDDEVVFVVKDKDGDEVKVRSSQLTADQLKLHGLLPLSFLPSPGHGGSGSGGGDTTAGPAGVDIERAKTDQAYYEANAPAIRKWLQGGK